MKKAVVLVGVAALALARVSMAAAEVSDQGHGTVIVGPSASGPMTTEGSADFDSSGIQANASGRGQQPAPAPRSSDVANESTAPAAPVAFVAATNTPTCGGSQQGYTYSPVVDAAGQPLILTANGAPSSCPSQPPQPPAPAPLPPNPSPQQLAEAASASQPWPSLVVGINPGTGLTGLASWFWLGAGSPRIPDATASAGGLTVKVRATLVDVHWEFGDGSSHDSGTDLGQAYPAQSDVSHVYQTEGNDQVSVSLVFSVEYAVGDGPWQPLGTKSRAYTRPYSINQLQPQAVGT